MSENVSMKSVSSSSLDSTGHTQSDSDLSSMALHSETVVDLVGAGPGDPGLLTVAACSCLKHADIIIYDYLASEAVLRFGRKDAERHFVGKKGFSHHVTQDQINDLLLDCAKRHPGSHIVRLKGGDPFVFGRGGEEALALHQAGIRFRIIPGVTAGIAAPAYAGIPVTHRGISSSVTLVTGHEMAGKPETAINWHALAQSSDTLCFYMGIRDLPRIVDRLCAFGRDPKTPIALVRWGTTPQQEVLVATLETVVERVHTTGFSAPAIIVVGDVVSLHKQLSWYQRQPLAGTTVVVTRARAQASEVSYLIRSHGGQAIEYPTISIAPRAAQELEPTCVRLAQPNGYDWVVFTSANGVRCFFDQIKELGYDARLLGSVRVAAIGPATAQELVLHGIHADLVPPRFIAESVAVELINAGVGQDTHVLLARASEARATLPDTLASVGATVDIVPLYDTVIPEDEQATSELVKQLKAHSIDAVLFSSSSTVRNFLTRLDRAVGSSERCALLRSVALMSIGPVTSQTIHEAGLCETAQAEHYTITGLVAALEATVGTKGQRSL